MPSFLPLHRPPVLGWAPVSSGDRQDDQLQRQEEKQSGGRSRPSGDGFIRPEADVDDSPEDQHQAARAEGMAIRMPVATVS
jgi:hypothetical protein